jgi:hypothetical protein
MLPEKYSVVWELIQQWWGKSIIALKMSRRWERWLLSRYIRKWLLRTQTRSPCTILKVNEYRLPSSLELPNQDLAIGEIIPRLTVRFVIAWHYLRYCTGCCLELVGAVYINANSRTISCAILNGISNTSRFWLTIPLKNLWLAKLAKELYR